MYMVKVLVNVLKDYSQLTYLDLSRNKISNKGTKAISQAFYSNTTLTSFDLCRNEIEDKGIKELVKTFQNNQKLFLDVNNNLIGAEGS